MTSVTVLDNAQEFLKVVQNIFESIGQTFKLVSMFFTSTES